MGTKHYDKHFKEQAVKLGKQHGSTAQVARELGMGRAKLVRAMPCQEILDEVIS